MSSQLKKRNVPPSPEKRKKLDERVSKGSKRNSPASRVFLGITSVGFLSFAIWNLTKLPHQLTELGIRIPYLNSPNLSSPSSSTSTTSPQSPIINPTSSFAHYYQYMTHPLWPKWGHIQFEEEGTVTPPSVLTGRVVGVKLPKGEVGRLKPDFEKMEAVREAFWHSWKGYESYAWECDEIHPLSRVGSNLTQPGSIGYTIVDSIDTMIVMGLTDEYERARDWVRDALDFDKDGDFNTFETTIRVLGGLLSAHYLSSIHTTLSTTSDPEIFLSKAIDLADRLLPAFNTPTGLPYSLINLAKRTGSMEKGNAWVSLAEAASLQLEFKYLSHLTGDMVYWKKAEKVTAVIRSQSMQEGICPIYLDPRRGQFVSSEIRLGSRGDSYYEYLLKQYLQTNRREPVYRDMYDTAMQGIKSLMMDRTPREGLLYTQELHPHPRTHEGQENGWRIVPKQDHLVCFLGGSFLLGITEGNRLHVDWNDLTPVQLGDYLAGTGIIDTCVDTYSTATGLGPEIAMFWLPQELTGNPAPEGDWYTKSARTNPIDSRNILRPETVESLFLAYRITGDQKYRDQGWKIFQAFQRWCRVEGGYVGVPNVERVPDVQDGTSGQAGVERGREDKMETFWLSETLKYLYLLFDDSESIPIDRHVFNTEAHIFPVFEPTQLTLFSTS